MQPCNSSWPLPLAGGKVISTQTTQEKFSRRFQERGGDNCFGEHVKQGKALSLSTKSIDDAIHNSKLQDQTVSKEMDNHQIILRNPRPCLENA